MDLHYDSIPSPPYPDDCRPLPPPKMRLRRALRQRRGHPGTVLTHLVIGNGRLTKCGLDAGPVDDSIPMGAPTCERCLPHFRNLEGRLP